jgi:hypothetical protein
MNIVQVCRCRSFGMLRKLLPLWIFFFNMDGSYLYCLSILWWFWTCFYFSAAVLGGVRNVWMVILWSDAFCKLFVFLFGKIVPLKHFMDSDSECFKVSFDTPGTSKYCPRSVLESNNTLMPSLRRNQDSSIPSAAFLCITCFRRIGLFRKFNDGSI